MFEEVGYSAFAILNPCEGRGHFFTWWLEQPVPIVLMQLCVFLLNVRQIYANQDFQTTYCSRLFVAGSGTEVKESGLEMAKAGATSSVSEPKVCSLSRPTTIRFSLGNP
jgi:hypothetical protein